MNTKQTLLRTSVLYSALMLTAVTPRGFSQGGVPLWTNLYNGGNGGDTAMAIATDRNGNVVVVGNSPGSNGLSDFATVAYSGAGVPLWTNRYGSPGSVSGVAGIAVDGNGNAFVTGSGGDEFLTVGYSDTGVPLWTNSYNGPGTGGGRVLSIAVDKSGNVFVAGGSSREGSAYVDFTTLAYSGAGVERGEQSVLVEAPPDNRHERMCHQASGRGRACKRPLTFCVSLTVIVTGSGPAALICKQETGSRAVLWQMLNRVRTFLLSIPLAVQATRGKKLMSAESRPTFNGLALN
jgi:hypothetical protein